MARSISASIRNILPDVGIGGELSCNDIIYYDVKRRRSIDRKHPFERPEAKKNCMFIVYKDKDNIKRVQGIVDPDIEIFFVKPEYRTFKTPREYIEKSKCYSIKCKPQDVVKTIEQEIQKSDDPISRQFMEIQNSTYRNLSLAYNSLDRSYYWSLKKRLNHVQSWPYVLFSDLDVELYYRILIGNRYNQSRNHTVDKCFLDIESDIFGLTSTQTAENKDKTNACTLIFDFDQNGSNGDKKPMVFTFLLRDYDRYPQQENFENRLSQFVRECHKHFDHQTIIQDGKQIVIDTQAEYHIRMFDDEVELISSIFKTINYYRPDVCMVWNIAYDLPKLRARLENNGVDPVDVMCDPAWSPEYRFLDFRVDNRPIDTASKKTTIRMASTTLFMDQMQNYASARKGRKAYGSDRLDNIANVELGVGKWEFKPGINVTNAAILDYWNFVLYNIRDVWAQFLIDRVTGDSTALIFDMNQSFCPVHLLHKQITYNRQIYYTQRLNRGFISGNNRNVNYLKGETEEELELRAEWEEYRRRLAQHDVEVLGDDSDSDVEIDPEIETTNTATGPISDEDAVAFDVLTDVTDVYRDSIDRKIKLQGGLVGNPDNNLPNGAELIQGTRSKHIVLDVLDMDYASEYPWAKYTRSLSMSTQFGRLIIGEKISDRQNVLPMGMQKRPDDAMSYIPGAEFVMDYLSGDVVQFGNVWFGLPEVEEMDRMLMESVDMTGVLTA